MRKLLKIPLVLTSLLVAVSLVGVPAVASAVGNTGATNNATPGDQNHSNNATTLQERQARLQAVKLKVCQQRQTAIDDIMARIADRGQRQLDLFTDIATRVETFATNHNQQPSDYNSLVTAVTTAETSAQTTVNDVKTASTSFNCDGTNPQGAASAFKTALKNEIAALKTYRTSVKNLIEGVKSAKSASHSNSTNTTDTNTTNTNTNSDTTQNTTGGNQ